ncbi:reverse transcriptase domain-containing protein [Tanacetum coccineum]
MSLVKRSDAAPVCHGKPLDSIKNWNDHFFWDDSTAFPLSVSLKSQILKMDLFAFIRHSDPTKVRIREREPAEREVKLMTLTDGRTVSLNPLASAASGDSGDSIDKLFDEGVMLDRSILSRGMMMFWRKLFPRIFQRSLLKRPRRSERGKLSGSLPVTALLDMEDDVDISTLTIEQYIALIPDDIKPCIVNPKIGNDVEFEINANFMRELRRKLFADTDDEDAYEHVRKVLEIVDLFHFPDVTHDAIMLRVFPITLKGQALRWKNRLPAGTITTWDLLKKEFILRYCHPFITAKKLKEICNFKKERDETLYHAWERYNNLLYQCTLHDLNSQQKVYIFYTGLDISTRKFFDSNGFIPLMTPTQALESIQVMADHSHNSYDETTTRERIKDVIDNVDAIHESFKGEHLTKEHPLKKDEAIKHSRYMESLEETIIKFCEDTIKKYTANNERMRKILENTESNIRALKTTTKNLQEKAYQLTHKVLTNTREKVKAIMKTGKENIKEPDDEWDTDVGWDITNKNAERLRQFLTPTKHTLPNLKPVVQPYIPLGPVHDKDKIVREEEQDYDINLNDSVIQPLTPQTVYITPPDDDYVAPATNTMSNKQLNKSDEEFSNITKVAEKEYDNPEIYDCENFIRKLLHQVSQSSKEMKSQQQYGSNLSFPYPVANHGVHCYSHSHLILVREGTPYYLANKGEVKLVTQTKTSTLWETPHDYLSFCISWFACFLLCFEETRS